MSSELDKLVETASGSRWIKLTPNQVVSWNLRRLRNRAGMSQERLAGLMTHFGIKWTMFTVSDAEVALQKSGQGRRFTVDELAILSLIFYVTPAELMVPPARGDLEDPDVELAIDVGEVSMTRESFLTDVLLRPSGVATRGGGRYREVSEFS